MNHLMMAAVAGMFCSSMMLIAGNNVVLADVTTPWMELLKKKNFSDLSGNNVNHPNDFGHRLYAQIILELFPLASETAKEGQ